MERKGFGWDLDGGIGGGEYKGSKGYVSITTKRENRGVRSIDGQL